MIALKLLERNWSLVIIIWLFHLKNASTLKYQVKDSKPKIKQESKIKCFMQKCLTVFMLNFTLPRNISAEALEVVCFGNRLKHLS